MIFFSSINITYWSLGKRIFDGRQTRHLVRHVNNRSRYWRQLCPLATQLQQSSHSTKFLINPNYNGHLGHHRTFRKISRNCGGWFLSRVFHLMRLATTVKGLIIYRVKLYALQDPTLRPRIWKILLHVNDVSADEFAGYVVRGACSVRDKIRNDTFRWFDRYPRPWPS